MTELVFKLNILFDQPVGDAAGSWQYAGAAALETTTREAANLAATKRVNEFGGHAFPASILTGTLMFKTGGHVPDFITFQGVHDLKSHNEIGTLTAASPRFGEYVGGTFHFDAPSLLLTLAPLT